MSAEERIAAVEACLEPFQAKREEVVHFLVWEIGKTVLDAEKEFDRMIRYVRDTVSTYREMVGKGREAIASSAGGIQRRPDPGVLPSAWGRRTIP